VRQEKNETYKEENSRLRPLSRMIRIWICGLRLLIFAVYFHRLPVLRTPACTLFKHNIGALSKVRKPAIPTYFLVEQRISTQREIAAGVARRHNGLTLIRNAHDAIFVHHFLLTFFRLLGNVKYITQSKQKSKL
jgi:hypothetical protein